MNIKLPKSRSSEIFFNIFNMIIQIYFRNIFLLILTVSYIKTNLIILNDLQVLDNSMFQFFYR